MCPNIQKTNKWRVCKIISLAYENSTVNSTLQKYVLNKLFVININCWWHLLYPVFMYIILFQLTKTSVRVKTYQLSFHVFFQFICAFHQQSLDFFSKCFLFIPTFKLLRNVYCKNEQENGRLNIYNCCTRNSTLNLL